MYPECTKSIGMGKDITTCGRHESIVCVAAGSNRLHRPCRTKAPVFVSRKTVTQAIKSVQA